MQLADGSKPTLAQQQTRDCSGFFVGEVAVPEPEHVRSSLPVAGGDEDAHQRHHVDFGELELEVRRSLFPRWLLFLLLRHDRDGLFLRGRRAWLLRFVLQLLFAV